MAYDGNFPQLRPNNATQTQRTLHRTGEITNSASNLEVGHSCGQVHREDAPEAEGRRRWLGQASIRRDHGTGGTDQGAGGERAAAIESLLQPSLLDRCSVRSRFVCAAQHQ